VFRVSASRGEAPRGSPAGRPARRAGPYRVAVDDVGPPFIRRERKRRRRRGHGGRVVAMALLVLAVLAASGTAALVIVARSPQLIVGCALASTHPHRFGRDTFVYAADGSRLGTVPTSQNREPLPLNEMSPWLPLATVAIEDRRFWRHGALDYEA